MLLARIHQGDGSRIQHRRSTFFDLRFCIKTALSVPVPRTGTVYYNGLTKYNLIAFFPHLSNQCLARVDNACESEVQADGELTPPLFHTKTRVDVPDFNIFIWTKGLQDMLPRDPHGAEAYVSGYQFSHSSSIGSITHHGVKVFGSRQKLQSRGVSKCPRVSMCEI